MVGFKVRILGLDLTRDSRVKKKKNLTRPCSVTVSHLKSLLFCIRII